MLSHGTAPAGLSLSTMFKLIKKNIEAYVIQTTTGLSPEYIWFYAEIGKQH